MMSSNDVKRVFIWLAGIIILFYWMTFFIIGTHLDRIFELAVTLLVAEKVIELYEYIEKSIEEVEDA